MNWRLTFLLVALALPGVFAVSWLAVPVLVAGRELPVPLATLQVVSVLQGTVLTVLAACVGALVVHRVGLGAPFLEAIVAGRFGSASVRILIGPGVAGGIFGAAILVAFDWLAPDSLAQLHDRGSIPIVARLLYGGITEEVLVRWGGMSVLAWIGWRLLQGGRGKASGLVMWSAVVLSAVAFGVAHVPAVNAVAGAAPLSIVLYVTFVNAAFGGIAGILFWRCGFEAAMLAHILAHLLAYIARG